MGGRLALAIVAATAAALLVAGSAGAVNNVTCGSTIKKPGMYKLREDCSGKGITIASNDVTLDLARHTMTGTGASGNFGIYAVDVGNVRIVGPGVIKKYYEGMLLAEVIG